MKLGELDDEKSLKDASYYQELTFKALHEFILEESKLSKYSLISLRLYLISMVGLLIYRVLNKKGIV